jgi:hypothetical protein
MFTKLAQFRLFGRGRALPALPTIGHHSDDRDNLLVGNLRRARRPTLVCRWRNAPSGGLECVWHTVGAGCADKHEPVLLDQRILRLTDVRAAARRPFIRTAA